MKKNSFYNISQFYRFVIVLAFFSLMTLNSYAQEERKYTTHVVKDGESIRSIAKLYDTKSRVIKNLNPDVKRNRDLKVNMTLVVPKTGKALENNNPSIVENQLKKRKSHKVKKGETVYSIAKKYQVTMQSLKEINNLNSNDLTLNQILLIPNKEDFTVTNENKQLMLYNVMKGDTKYNLSKRYNIEIESIEKLNPHLKKEELKVGSSIWLPYKKTQEDNETVTDSNIQNNQTSEQPFIYHQYKKDDDLFRLAVMYGTTVAEIKAMNPENFKKLRPGMLLKIPGKKKDNFLMHKVEKGETIFRICQNYSITQEELFTLNPAIKEKLPEGVEIYIRPLEIASESSKFNYPDYMSGQVNVSFFMPMFSEETINMAQNTKKSYLRKIITDYYMGASLAIKDLEKKGLRVNYHVYDTKNNKETINRFINDPFVESSDIIIGPFFFENAAYVSRIFKDKTIVSPIFSKDQVTNRSKNLIKTGTNPKELNTKLADYLADFHTNEKIILVTDYASSNQAQKIETALKAKNIKYTKILPSTNKKNQIYLDKDRMTNAIDSSLPNWIVLISENNIVLSDAISTYGVIAFKDNLTLFTNKEIKNFEHINISYLTHLKWSFPVINYSGLEQARTFESNYKAQYYDAPTEHAYNGYDTTYDILSRFSSNSLDDSLNNMYSVGLSKVFDYRQSNRNFENKGAFIVQMTVDYNFKSASK